MTWRGVVAETKGDRRAVNAWRKGNHPTVTGSPAVVAKTLSSLHKGTTEGGIRSLLDALVRKGEARLTEGNLERVCRRTGQPTAMVAASTY